MFRIRVAITAFLWAFLWPLAVFAQDVTLTSRDGQISVAGNFLSFDGEFYRVETDLGALTIDSSGVICEGPACPSLDGYFAQVRISGDDRVIETLLPALIEAFARRQGYALAVNSIDRTSVYQLIDSESGITVGEFSLFAGTSGEGFADLMAENADIVASIRRISRKEQQSAIEAGVGDLYDPLRARVLALDALVPISNRAVQTNRMTLDQLARIFSGAVTNWQEIDGKDAPIAAHILGEDLIESSKFFQHVLAPRKLSIFDGVTVHDKPAALAAAVKADPYAIGIGRMSSVNSVALLGLSGACGFRASTRKADVKTEDYPFTRPVFLYTPARRLPALAREFMTYTNSPSAQTVIARTPFVDQAVEHLSFRDQGQRFANAISSVNEEVDYLALQDVTRALQGAERLTLGFRFEDGSTQLDAQSRSNIVLLSELLEAGVYDQKKLLFAGFSDGLGSAAQNKALSQRRAEAVLRAVRRAVGEAFEASNVTLESKGFGEVMPLACDDVAWGRSLNRRVEVWLTDQR